MKTKMESAIKGYITLVSMGLFLFAVFKIGWLVGKITNQDVVFPLKASTTQSAAHDISVRESNADHGDTLEEVMLGISNETYEYEAIFYGERKIAEFTDYDKKKTSFSCQWSDALAADMIAVHNHPLDCAFSYQDLDGFCRYQYAGTGIVVSSDTKYTLSAPDGWPSADELASYFATEYGFNTDFDADTCIVRVHVDYDRLEQMYCDGYAIPFSANSFGLTGKAISEFADSLGLIYTEEPLSDITSF